MIGYKLTKHKLKSKNVLDFMEGNFIRHQSENHNFVYDFAFDTLLSRGDLRREVAIAQKHQKYLFGSGLWVYAEHAYDLVCQKRG